MNGLAYCLVKCARWSWRRRGGFTRRRISTVPRGLPNPHGAVKLRFGELRPRTAGPVAYRRNRSPGEQPEVVAIGEEASAGWVSHSGRGVRCLPHHRWPTCSFTILIDTGLPADATNRAKFR